MSFGIVSLIVLIIIAGIIMAIRSRSSSSEPGMEGVSVTRHVWLYLISLISLGIFAFGIGQLLTLLFDVTIRGSYLVRPELNQQQLSLGLAMTVIGGPLWLIFWRSIRRRVKGSHEEIGAPVRKLYLNFIITVTALTGLTAAGELLRWLLEGVPAASFSSDNLATLIVAGVLWLYHWRVSEGEGHPSGAAKTLRRWYVYILSGVGLVWLTTGTVQLIDTAVASLPVWDNVLAGGGFWNEGARVAIAQIVFGSLAWYFHWFRMASGDVDSTLRQAYFYLLAISGGAVAALVASTVLLYRVFGWLFGVAGSADAGYFQFIGWAVPTVIVGTAIWGYHRSLAQEEAGKVGEKRESARRVYYYLMSFLGLSTAVAGLVMLTGILIDLIIDAVGGPIAITPGWWRDQLALCLALLVVGMPVWLYYWNIVLKRVQTEGKAEWQALSRRIFLYFVVGVAIITLAADLVNIIYQLLTGFMAGAEDVGVLQASKWSLQTLVVAVAVFWYHWQMLRADQRRGAEEIEKRCDVTLITGEEYAEVVSSLEDRLGYKIQLIKASEEGIEIPAAPAEEDLELLAKKIKGSSSGHIMLVKKGDRIIMLPYDVE